MAGRQNRRARLSGRLMIIPINDSLRIRGVEHCWHLEKARTRNGECEWTPFKYFNSVGEAVGAACRRDIRLHPANTLADAIEAVDEIAARYNKLLDAALNEVESRAA